MSAGAGLRGPCPHAQQRKTTQRITRSAGVGCPRNPPTALVGRGRLVSHSAPSGEVTSCRRLVDSGVRSPSAPADGCSPTNSDTAAAGRASCVRAPAAPIPSPRRISKATHAASAHPCTAVQRWRRRSWNRSPRTATIALGGRSGPFRTPKHPDRSTPTTHLLPERRSIAPYSPKARSTSAANRLPPPVRSPWFRSANLPPSEREHAGYPSTAMKEAAHVRQPDQGSADQSEQIQR